MKIPSSFEIAYKRVYPNLERLELLVEPRVREIAESYNSAYSARIKSPESVLIKAEKERFKRPFIEMDDLFACTITVPNSLLMKDVLRDVRKNFEVVEERRRKLKPIEFDFDDLILSLKIRDNFSIKDTALLDLAFELQIKTLLQQAWSQAGHDVIYKAKRKTWGLSRIASQVRALLEMADTILANLESAADILQDSVEHLPYNKTNQIVDILDSTWDIEKLPANLYRAAQIVAEYLRLAGLEASKLNILLQEDKYQPFVTARSITPTQVIFIILFEEKRGDILGRLKKDQVLITAEMYDLCPNLKRIPPGNLVSYSNL